MSDAPPTRTPKRQRKKEGAQARRAAEMAALRRRQRNRRIVRFAVMAVVAVAVVLFFSMRGGDDAEETASTDTESTEAGDGSTTTVAPVAATLLTCERPSGEHTDMTAKPTPEAPDAPATELTCQDLVVGDGEEVLNSNDTVTVHYVGIAQSNGEEFDTSWGGEPATFPLTGVIAGWTEGIPGMKVGGRRLLTIPGDKAYGPSGGQGIGPNETLVFIVDLLEVNPGS